MPLQIIRNDITKLPCDAVVNPTDAALSGSGGTDMAIHAAAGAELRRECDAIGGLKVGGAELTRGYKLPCRYVIHTAGMAWHGGGENEEAVLRSCYRSALSLAAKKGFESVAIPIIAAGSFGYPKDRALSTAVDEISKFLMENEMQIYLVVYDKEIFRLSGKLFADIKSYIDDNYIEQRAPEYTMQSRPIQNRPRFSRLFSSRDIVEDSLSMPCARREESTVGSAPPTLYTEIKPAYSMPLNAAVEGMDAPLDEGFRDMLFRKIDERGMSDAQCYKKANIDRRLFAKIRNNPDYRPSKSTALAFAVALELDLHETEELLKKAGYALTRSSRADIIVMYFIQNRRYNIFEINEALFYYDQTLLGSA